MFKLIVFSTSQGFVNPICNVGDSYCVVWDLSYSHTYLLWFSRDLEGCYQRHYTNEYLKNGYDVFWKNTGWSNSECLWRLVFLLQNKRREAWILAHILCVVGRVYCCQWYMHMSYYKKCYGRLGCFTLHNHLSIDPSSWICLFANVGSLMSQSVTNFASK